eukprot:1892331-Alexandrium_andersonii.AAC.1
MSPSLRCSLGRGHPTSPHGISPEPTKPAAAVRKQAGNQKLLSERARIAPTQGTQGPPPIFRRSRRLL